MKFRIITIAAALAALVVAGCGKQEEAKAAAPAAPAATGPRVIEVTANDTMKYNLNTIELKVGEEVKIKLTNTGTMPKQAMGHNLVVLKAGSDAGAFSQAAASVSPEHIPDALKGEIIAHTKMLGPKESDTVTLKFTEAGDYPFLCSFPAHFQVGMKGNIIVK